jgi:serine/threonine protein kinase
LEVVEVMRVGVQVAAALSAAHRQGLVHRDIKPSNILLDQGTERVRVADFGLARAANDADFTRSGTIAGTPLYMAPEQVRGEACDSRSDLFSLGSLMYTLCAGHPPFRGETVYAVMQRIVHDQPRSLREHNVNIPDWLEDFVLGLLAKDKSARFATADEVVKILERELAYHQSPRAGAEPDRSWRNACGTTRARRVSRWRVPAMIASTVAFVAVYAFWLVYASMVGNNDNRQTSASLSIEETPPTVPLWDHDGMRETLAAARELDARSWQVHIEEEPDLWQRQARQIRQRLVEVSANQNLWISESR